MIMFKKLASIILGVSFLLASTLSSVALAEENDCPRNPKGGYVRAICADELLNVGLYKTSDYENVENLGVFGNEQHCAFNFRALDRLFEEKKLISTERLENQYNLLKAKCEKSSNIFEKDNILFIIGGSLIGAVVGLFGFKSSKIQDSIDQKDSYQVPTSHSSSGTLSSLNGIIGTVIGAISAIIGLKMKSKGDCDQEYEVIKQIDQVKKANKINSRIFNSLLYFLERPEHINFDMVYYQIDKKENDFHWNTNFAGIDYTKEEMESFPQKFKEIAAKIRKNLEENHELSPLNKK